MAIECDVLVVGAGPAGSSAARAAAMGGAKTILIDKKKEVGVPVQCAEGIGKYLFPYLPFPIPKKLLKWKIEGMRFHADQVSISRKGELWDGYSIDRNEFDKWLVDKAISAGAQLGRANELIDLKIDNGGIVQKARIKTQKKEIDICPRVVIGADGAESTVLKLLGLYNPKKEDVAEVYSWEMSNLKLKEPHFEQIYFGDFAPEGYGYIFPKTMHSANVGVGGICSKKKIREKFYEFLENGNVEEQVADSTFIKEKKGKAVIRDIVDNEIIRNVILAGDSGNHNIKPFIEGILPAVISGNLAGEVGCLKYLGKKIELREYKEKLVSLMPESFRESEKIIQKVYEWESMGKEKHLLFLGLASEIFMLEKIGEIEDMNYKKLESKILEKG